MENNRIHDRERLQMEQILQLDSEELQVEEVDDDESSEESYDDNHRNSGEASASGDFNYDTSLAASHSYLGDVDDIHSRLAFLDGGAIFNLPMLYLQGVVLFPEATLPLRVIEPHFLAAIERALTQVEVPCTIGVVHAYEDPHNGATRFAKIGSTAEIRKYHRLEDGSINIIARGQQRFRLRRRWVSVEGATYGEIQIIQEDSPLRTPREAVGKLTPRRTSRMQPLNCNSVGCEEGNDSDEMSEDSFESELSMRERRLHNFALAYADCVIDDLISSDNETNEAEMHLGSSQRDILLGLLHKEDSKSSEGAISSKQTFRRIKKLPINRSRDFPGTFWPSWVYQMYDSYCLAQNAADMWKQIVRAHSMDGLVRKPGLLSFHIASKIPVSESTRQELLEIDGISYRLQREIELLESFNRIQCKTCEALIARRTDMVVMSSEGPSGAYVNQYGHMHQVMTLHRANGLVVTGSPVKDFSWFPGYAWSIAQCSTCESHMGWLFTAVKKTIKPRSFWGIRGFQVSKSSA